MSKKLLVRLGLDPSGFEKALKSAARSLNTFSRRTEKIGRTLTNSLSIPIAGVGIAAIKSAADFEQLTNQLTAVTGSSEESARQIAALKKIAEAPGLGFEQAVSAAARLQAVGLSAGDAQAAIQEFGNAVARSGGGANEFDGAILALTQIASKGKISAEEINQLNERIFEIRPALQKAFGTANSEELQKLGISSEEFIAKVTEEFAKLDRVQGGLANAFENVGISVKAFLADIGGVITNLFPVQEIVQRVSTFLTELAERFKALPESTQRTIIAVSAVVAAIGPLIFGISAVAAGLATVLSPIGLTVIAIGTLTAAFVAAYNQSQVFRDSVQVLGLVIKTIVVNAVEALGAAFQPVLALFRRGKNDASDLEKGFQQFGQKAIFSIEGVIRYFELLVKVLTLPRRLIQGIALAFGNLAKFIITENVKIATAISAAFDTKNPLQAIKNLKQVFSNISLADAGQGIADSFSAGFEAGFGDDRISNFFDKVREDVRAAQENINAIRFDKYNQAKEQAQTTLPTAQPEQAAEILSPTSESNPFRAVTEAIPVLQAELQSVSSLSVDTAVQVQESFARVGEELTSSIDKTNALQKAQQIYNNKLAATNLIAEQISGAFGELFKVVLNGGRNAFGAFTDALKNAVKELIVAIAKLVAFALITSIIFPNAGTFSQIFKSGIGSLTGVKLASGGIVTQSTFANVGEEGAEAIIPLDRLSDIGGRQELELRVEGTELVALLKNSESTYNRLF